MSLFGVEELSKLGLRGRNNDGLIQTLLDIDKRCASPSVLRCV
jgi:hypothetical protein